MLVGILEEELLFSKSFDLIIHVIITLSNVLPHALRNIKNSIIIS